MENRTVAGNWFFYSLGVFMVVFLSIAFVDNPSYEVKGIVLVSLAVSGFMSFIAALVLIYDELIRFK